MHWISVVKQYERAVIFRLGRYIGTRGPGLVILIPFIDRGVRVDMRELVLDEPAQSSITKDNALVDIDFVVYMRVNDPEAAVINVNNYIRAIRNMATTTLRSVIGDITVEEVLSQRETINQRLQMKLSAETARWGVEVLAIEIRDVLDRLPEDYRTAIEYRYMVGLSGQEAAAAMGKSHGSFRVLLHRATQAFQRAYQGEG